MGGRILVLCFFLSGYSFIAESFGAIIPCDRNANSPFAEVNLLHAIELATQAPAFWGQNLVGSDLVKEMLRHQTIPPVRVVVSDGGVTKGAISKVTLKAPPPPATNPGNLPAIIYIPIGSPKKDVEISLPDFEDYLKNKTPILETRWNKFKLIEAKTKIYLPIPIGLPKSQPTFHATHGSHVAGIVGTGRDLPFSVSPLADIEDMDVFFGRGGASPRVLHEAIQTLINRAEPVPVLNMSHELPNDLTYSNLVNELIEKKDSLCAVAAGNDSRRIAEKSSLNAITNCVVVGAYGHLGTKLSFSNYGERLDLLAPGDEILSVGQGFQVHFNDHGDEELELLSGTSMATPMVSGALATLRAILPKARGEDLRTLLFKTAIDLGAEGRDEFTGYGLLNTLRATQIALQLRTAGYSTPRLIQQSLSNGITYIVSSALIRQTIIERFKAHRDSEAYEQLLRKEALLEGRAEGFEKLGKYYLNERPQRMRKMGLGLLMTAYNRPESDPENAVDLKDLESFAENFSAEWKLAVDRSRDHHLNKVLINSKLRAALEGH